MIKLSALNDESDEESGSEKWGWRETPEQIAFKQYTEALDLQRKGNLPEATQLLRDLLDTELLYNVQKPAPGEKAPGQLFNLKYSCYKNLAAMLTTTGEVDAAIDAYLAASELDNTDVTLWHRFGLLCLKTNHYEMALKAFQNGTERNPRHWPCLDKSIILLLALDFRIECIVTIHNALLLDPGYLRGLVYRRYIFTRYTFEKDYLEYVNPIYKWNENEEQIDEAKASMLLKEALDIQNIYYEQQKAEEFRCIVPHVKLKNPITQMSWKAVGDALVNMHHHMTETYFSHACPLELVVKIEKLGEKMEVCEDNKELDIVVKPEENVTDIVKNTDITSETENNDMSDKDKPVTDTEKMDSDIESAADPKSEKKKFARRKKSTLSNLEPWEWYTSRRSKRKKQLSKKDTIYDVLRQMVPIGLRPEMEDKQENEKREMSPNLSKLFDENNVEHKETNYFGSEIEEKDVRLFIAEYTESKHDIINMLKNYLGILAAKWKLKWDDGLIKVFLEANECYNTHIDFPACTDDNQADLIHYTGVNLLAEELIVNEKLNNSDENVLHEAGVIQYIAIILSLKPHIFVSTDCLEYTLRHLWVKFHIQVINKSKTEGLELDNLFGLLQEFDALGESRDTYNLNVVNFTYKPNININEIIPYIHFFERSIKLEAVRDLYSQGKYEEVVDIVTDTFEHFKTLATEQEDEVTLDFADYLSIILDTYWALGQIENCFQWTFTCLHEALKHYFRHTSGSADYKKWTLTVVKILCSIEHMLTDEGVAILDSVSQRDLSQGLEDLIRIIGHQVETNASDMPLNTVAPWIIMYYILQREEDQGRGRPTTETEPFYGIPIPLMVLFIGHEQLGGRSWCCKSDGKLLYFTLDTVIPQIRSPALSKSLETICQFMEQCVYCLFGHPTKKHRAKYLEDHKVQPKSLDWLRAQQLYEIVRPLELPGLIGKSGITSDTESLFSRIIALLSPECDPNKYVPDFEKYIQGIESKLPVVPQLLPYKMKDIYFLLGDHFFKKDDYKDKHLAIKYNTFDIIVNNDRFESWAQLTLAKAKELENLLNSCKNFKNDKEFLDPAQTVIRCFRRTLQLGKGRALYTIWNEYGCFVYAVHSFCSRLLKQASESLSMEDFESLEKQKENMLQTSQKCFSTVLADFNEKNEGDRTPEEIWQVYYMLGKVAEKLNKPPSTYLNYYIKGIKCLQEAEATYSTKINYGSPTKLCFEVLELHYRIHASILKYIEQHENKPIPTSVGKVFLSCIEAWLKGPFARRKRQEGNSEGEGETKTDEPVQAANILKRSISDAGEEDTQEAKRLKLESAAAKVRRSASYDTERSAVIKETDTANTSVTDNTKYVPEEATEIIDSQEVVASGEVPSAQKEENKTEENEPLEQKQDVVSENKDESSSSTSSSSSSDSSSSDSTSDSSSDSGKETDTSSKSSNDSKPLTDDEIMKIISACIEALEDCASRFPQHYKAIYRLAHYHFYYKKGKNIERCRDLMLSTFTSSYGQKLGGLFNERRNTNFFNNIWKLLNTEVDRGGSFAFHMNRSVLLTMEILKEIDDYKTLLELSLHLQRIPDPGKQYLRDSEREELAQQAFSLCIQSLKGQLMKFSQQPDLKTNEVEQQAMNSLMIDIYRAYQKVQKQPNSKQFINLIIEGYKLMANGPFENKNMVDLSMKYVQSLSTAQKQQATQASLIKSQNLQKKQVAKAAEIPKSVPTPLSAPAPTPKPDPKPPAPTPSSSSKPPALPKLSAQDMTAAFQNFMPMLHDPLMTQHAAAALSYLSNISATMALQKTLQSSLQYSLQNSFQAEFFRQCVGQPYPFNLPPPKKQKRAPKASTASRTVPSSSTSKPKPVAQPTSLIKAIPTQVITSQKSTPTLAPSMGTVLPTLPASMTANLTSFGGHSSHSSSVPTQAHMSSPSTATAAMHSKPPMPHQQVSPGKTLQEKLAERQKSLPSGKHPPHDGVSREISHSISRLPSSLTITKTSVPKQPMIPGKRPEAKKSLPFSEEGRPKPVSSDEIIVLDDD